MPEAAQFFLMLSGAAALVTIFFAIYAVLKPGVVAPALARGHLAVAGASTTLAVLILLVSG